MPDEKTDLKEDQVVADPDLTAQVVDEQGVKEAELADGTSQEKDIPYSKFKKEIDAKKVAEAAQQAAEQQTEQARNQLAALQAQQQAPQARKTNYERALQETGLDGEEYLTQEQRIRVEGCKEQLDVAAINQQNAVIASQQFVQSHSDYGVAVGYTDQFGQFMPSAELNKILTENPHLRGSCATAQGAYKVVMDHREVAKLREDVSALTEQQGQQEIDDNLAPMGSSAAGGGGGSRVKGLINANSTAKEILAVQADIRAGVYG